MTNKPIAIYLNDHLAGSVTALQILDSLLKRQTGTPLERDLVELKNEIADDRRELEILMARLHIPESSTRKTAAWFSEKLYELKAQVDDPSGQLFLLEALDTLSIGIEGKALLWKALDAAAKSVHALQGMEYDYLIQRAAAQRNLVEKMRLRAARSALANGTREWHERQEVTPGGRNASQLQFHLVIPAFCQSLPVHHRTPLRGCWADCNGHRWLH